MLKHHIFTLVIKAPVQGEPDETFLQVRKRLDRNKAHDVAAGMAAEFLDENGYDRSYWSFEGTRDDVTVVLRWGNDDIMGYIYITELLADGCWHQQGEA